jgi:hypothetical protein
MRNRFVRLAFMALVINAAAQAALALSFPGPLSFSFFNPVMNAWFLWPFTITGCV